MASFGELITSLHADWSGYEKDLNKALKLLEEFHGKSQRIATTSLQARQRATGASGATAGAGLIDPIKLQAQQRTEFLQLEAGVRKFSAIQEQATKENTRRVNVRIKQTEQEETRLRRFYANWDRAIDENLKRELAAQAARQKAAQTFFRSQSGASAPGGPPSPGSFIQPKYLDEAAQKWLKTQQEIAKNGGAVERLSAAFNKRATEGLKGLASEAKNAAKAITGIGAAMVSATVVGGALALGRQAIIVNSQYQRGKIALAEILSLTTDLVDKQGRVASAALQMRENYVEAAKLILQVRREAVRTTLTTQELLTTVQQTTGFALAGGAKTNQVVPLIAQISNLAKSLGAEGEQQIGQETRALLTGQMLRRSRIGRALGLNKDEIEDAVQSGKIVQFLTEKLKAGKPYLDDYAKSYAGLTTTLTSKANELLRQATEKTFEKITAALGDVNKKFDEKTIADWAERASEALTQFAERLKTLADLPIWGTLQRNFGFLFIDPSEATERQIARTRAARGPETTAVELARLRVRGRQRDLQAAEGAAAGRALPLAEAAGAGAKGISGFISEPDRREIEVRRRLLAQSQREQQAAEETLTRVHIEHELKRGAATGAELTRVSKLRKGHDEEAARDAEEQRIKIAKQLAELRDDKIASIRAEAEEAKFQAQKDITDAKKVAEVIAAIEADRDRKIHELRNEERLTFYKDLSEMTGDRRQALRVEFEEAWANIQKMHLSREAAQRLELATYQGFVRKRIDLEREFSEKARELTKEYGDLVRKEHEERTSLAKESHTLEVNHAKEMQTYARERLKAVREYTRAVEDIPQEKENVQLSQSQRDLQKKVLDLLRANNGGPLSLGQETTVRDLSKRIAGGNPFEGDRAIAEAQRLGYASEGDRSQLVALGAQADRNRLRGDDLTEQNAGRQDRRRLEELGDKADDAKKRITELDTAHTEAITSYQEGVKEVKEKFSKAVEEITEGFRKLAPEMQKFMESVTASHIALTPQQRGAIHAGSHPNLQSVSRRIAGPAAAPGAAQVMSSADRNELEKVVERGVTQNNVFNITNASPETVTKMVASELEKQMRRTAPMAR